MCTGQTRHVTTGGTRVMSQIQIILTTAYLGIKPSTRNTDTALAIELGSTDKTKNTKTTLKYV